MSETMVEVRNLSFTYPNKVKALKNVSFKVEKGETLAIMGRNGAGKTTLCYHLNGVIPNVMLGDVKGEVIVAGMKTSEHAIYELTQKVGMLLEDPEGQLVSADVLGEVCFGPENLGLPKDEILRRAKWALKIVRLEGLEDRSPSELSGGQKQRLAIAAILTMLPEVLVLDEPTSQLDPIGTTEVFSVIEDLKEKHRMTIIIVTHKSELVAEFADKVLILDKGKVLAVGEPHEVFKKVNLLNETGVQPIPVSLLFKKLNSEEIPVTINEAKNYLLKILKGRGILKFDRGKFRENLTKRNEEPILEAKDLSFVYPGPPPVQALTDINIKIYPGEFVGIIGQNGSGKTTLVKCFLNVLRPTKGEILFKGGNIEKFTIAELATKIGLILQNPDHQLFTLSVREEIEFGLKNLNITRDEVNRRVEEALSLAGLSGKEEMFPFSLSFGDRRKLVVAAITAMKPEVVILDEPTTAQDFPGRYAIMDLAKKLNKQGKTIIVITHDMNLVAEYAKRCIVLRNGKVLLDGPTSRVFTEVEILKKAFLRPPQITRLARSLRDYGLYEGLLTVNEMYSYLKEAM